LLAASVTGCGGSTSGAPAKAESASAKPASEYGTALGPAAEKVPVSLKDKAVTVIVPSNYPPSGYMQDGKLVGRWVDLAKEIGVETGLQFKIEPAPSFDVIIPGLQAKRWDFAIPAFSVTDERRKILDFVTIAESGTGFMVRSSSEASIKAASDVCGIKAAVQEASVQATHAEALSKACQESGKPPVNVQTFKSNDDAIQAIASSRADVLITDIGQFALIIPESNGKFRAESFVYSKSPLAIGFPKGSELAPIVHQSVRDLMDQGVYVKIMEKYKSATDFKDPQLLQ
jgi:polar amino acid transport system substrate-binding protein